MGELVMKDMQIRITIGAKKYGTKLQTYNGRDALQDAYEKALDLVMYLKQAILEREGEMIECCNRKTVKEQNICCVREDFDEGEAYCQFVGKEHLCPQYNEDIRGCKMIEVEKYKLDYEDRSW